MSSIQRWGSFSQDQPDSIPSYLDWSAPVDTTTPSPSETNIFSGTVECQGQWSQVTIITGNLCLVVILASIILGFVAKFFCKTQ